MLIPGFFCASREFTFSVRYTTILPMKKSIRRFRYLIVLCAIIFSMMYYTIFGERGLLHLRKLRTDLKSINAEIARLGERNERLRNEIRLLQGDQKYIDDIARKELGMVREGELIYKRVK
jgi:cell division protein FtsB